jgi:membrane-bound serine protease (ClpP class)
MTWMLRVLPALLLALWLPGHAQPTSSAVWLLPIDTEITPATAQFVRSRVEQANREQPLALVFLIDTPGGRVDAMQDIVNAIMRRAQVPTIAIVENAFSAGALIAMSAERLAMLPGSSIGAALPIAATPIGIAEVDEKFNSAVRGQFRAVAEERGRDPRVAEGMVDQRIDIPGLATPDELVTLTAQQALEFGIADAYARSIQDALEQFGYGGVRIERIEPTLTERLAGSLANPIVAGLLLAIGIGGLLIEFFTPGFGIPGGIGAVALALFFGGAFLATPAGVFDLILILVGLALIAVELFVLPGFGIAGILGLAAIVFSTFRIFQESSVYVLASTVIFAGLLLGLALWLLPNARVGGFLTLNTRLMGDGRSQPATATAGAGAGGGPPEAVDPAKAKLVSSLEHLDGQRGVALSDLRPAGVARFEKARVDVVTEGDFVARGTPIEVLRVEGNRVTVRAVEPD